MLRFEVGKVCENSETKKYKNPALWVGNSRITTENCDVRIKNTLTSERRKVRYIRAKTSLYSIFANILFTMF